ncbi:MAG TPA: hypothetical protein IAD15_04190 [Candidatus Fimiplasma intestinipullorum]|uniref:Uncharacterized protein n=1 Tax=Candidatus Fimiplasma intestinipullorum TaxID=2840825 RepID=A0A9D1HM70_9FIRM|nr:hypothetical protein [Candidatus Fimiplasma intestinipullorum]
MKLSRKLKMLGIGTCVAATIVVGGTSGASARALLESYSSVDKSGTNVGASVETYSEAWTNGVNQIVGINMCEITPNIGYVANRNVGVSDDFKRIEIECDIKRVNQTDHFYKEHVYFR